MRQGRYGIGGFFNYAESSGGPISGHGPGFSKAMAQFAERQGRVAVVGRWRKAPARWKKNSGTYIDPEYYIVDWGQDG